MAQAFPIERYLVPRTVAGPPGFTKVEQPLRAGLPAAITLSPELSLVLTITTGLVKTWLELDPDIVVTQSFDQTIALPEGPEHDVGRVDRTAARLFVLRSGEVLGSTPLVAGRWFRVPSGGDAASGAALELIVVGWEIRAGTVKGAGDFGSSIRLFWRDVASGTDRFLPPAISPNILSRLRDRSRGASELGSNLRRLPAGYGPPPPPPPPFEPSELDIDLVDERYYRRYDVDYYTTYEVP